MSEEQRFDENITITNASEGGFNQTRTDGRPKIIQQKVRKQTVVLIASGNISFIV